MKELTEEEKKNFLEWAEGNKYLYELLCSCWENGITTFASCGGHENGNDCPYLGVIINNNSLPFIKSMLGQIQDMQNIEVSSAARGNGQLLADEELIRDIGFCYCSDEDIYFENEELLNKHLKYKNRESNLEK